MKLFSCTFQNKSKRVVSVLVAVSILLSALIVGITPDLFSVKADNETNPYAVRIEPNTTDVPFFGQWVSLKEGKTYIYSNCYLPETKPYQYIYKDTNDNQITDYEIVNDNDWSRQGLKFTVPADAMDDPNVSGNKLIWVGFRGHKSSNPLYYYDFKLYDVENPDVNLLKDYALLENGTSINKEVWVSPYNTEIKSTVSKVLLKDIGGTDMFKMTDDNRYAVKLAAGSTPKMAYFGQKLSLDKGETYTLSYYYKGTDSSFLIRINDGSYREITADEVIYDYETYKKDITFTVSVDDAGDKVPFWVGVRPGNNSVDSYYYDFKLYNVKTPGNNLYNVDSLCDGSSDIYNTVWCQPSKALQTDYYSKVSLKTAGGIGIFKKPTNVIKVSDYAWVQCGQNVVLEAGKTYSYSYYYSGPKEISAVLYDGNGSDTTKITPTNKYYDYEYKKITYEFVAPENATSAGEGKVKIYLGVQIPSKDTYYLYNPSVYAVDDETKTNLFNDYYFSGSYTLEGEGGTAGNWHKPYAGASGKLGWKFSRPSLESVGGIDTFKKPVANEPMVLKLAENAKYYPWFGQWVALERGKTYILSNCFSLGTEVTHRMYYKHADNAYDKSDLTADESIYDNEWLRLDTKFTVPEDAPVDADGKTIVWVGIRGDSSNNKDKPLYYYDFKLYDVDNSDVNLLKDAQLLVNGSDINKAAWIQPHNHINDSYSKVTLASVGGEEIFKIVPPSGALALKLEAGTANQPFFGQNVSLEKGKTYIFSNYYTPGTEPNQMVCYAGTENKIKYEIMQDVEWSRQSIKFTVPSDATDDPNIKGNKLLWLGFRGNKSDTPLYYYDFKLYEVENPNDNLLKDYELKDEVWELNKKVWVSPYGAINSAYKKVELESIGGMDIFRNPMAHEDMVLVLAPETTGMPFFGQWVTLEKGETYVFSNCFVPGTDAIQGVYLDDKGRELTDYDVTYDREWSKRKMQFTVPKNAPDNGNGKVSVWVGIRGYLYDGYLYYYDFELYNVKKPTVNLLRDSTLREFDTQFNTTLWKSPYNTQIKKTYGKVELSLLGGKEFFKRTGDVGPKMMYYTRTNRGPNHETYGCFTLSIPEELHVVGQNYVLEFDARSTKGIGLNNFRCGAIDPKLALDENNTIAPASINGYKYRFNLRFTDDMTKKLSFMIFVPEGSEGYISNLYMYKADKNFNKVSNRDLLKNAYADFSQFELGNYVEFYAKQGGCIDTETGKLESVPAYFFDIPPTVKVPSGDKMMSYASVWGAGTIVIKLPHTVKKGAIDGDNYIVSLTIRPTKGRDPSKFFSTGINGEHVQVYPASIDGYKYTFNLAERYDFSLVLEFPIDCEGYISNLRMYKADMDFKQVNSVNLATAFGKNGTFASTTTQQGMKWDGISFNGGFVNTFVDTRLLKNELNKGKLGEYHSSGGIWPIPNNFFVAQKDEGWADGYITDSDEGSGTIIGNIKDPEGSAINACAVVIKSMQDTTNVQKAISDKNGEFSFKSVPVGGYEVSIITADGNEVLGDMFAWIEEDKEIVTLSLVYDEGDAQLLSPGVDNTVKPVTSTENSNTSMWIWIGIGAFLVIVLVSVGVYLVIRLKKQKK